MDLPSNLHATDRHHNGTSLTATHGQPEIPQPRYIYICGKPGDLCPYV